MYILAFILALAVLILVHEFGHFAAAKLFGIRVDEFAIGFPPRIASVRRGETKYSINLLLFGGFVRIFGEDETTSNEPRSFAAKSRLIQAAVVVAGIVGNIVAAWLLLSAVLMLGMPAATDAAPGGGTVRDAHVTIVGVLPNSPAARAGLQEGDVIDQMQTGTTMLATSSDAASAREFIAAHGDESIVLQVKRAGADRTFLVRPTAGLVPGEPQRKAIGVEFANIGTVTLSFPRALIAGAQMTWDETEYTAQGLYTFFAQMFSGHADLSEVSGPVGIAKAGASAAADGWSAFLFFAAIISINLALINVLPIPGLDGGRLLFIVIESIRRKPLSTRLQMRLTFVGFALLIALMIVVTWHDIVRLF